MQLQNFLSWNKANIKHSCKLQLYNTKTQNIPLKSIFYLLISIVQVVHKM